MSIGLILLFINFGLFILSFIFIIIGILQAKKVNEKGLEENQLPKCAKYSYAFGLLAMLTMIFLSFFFLY
jgi:hypothetical protein